MAEAAKSKDEDCILVSNARLSYFYGFKPYEGDDGNKSYCAHLIIPESHPQMGAIQKLIRKVAENKFKGQADVVLKQLAAQDRLCIHRGDVSKPGQDAYKGKLYISASSKIKPRILATVGGINQEIDEDHDSAPYSGAWANVKINIWAQNNKWGKRINAGLMGVQFVRHDDRLSGAGRVASIEEFGLAASDADADIGSAGGDTGGLV